MKAIPKQNQAKHSSDEEVVELKGLVIVGTRAKPRSVLESTVPIDVVLQRRLCQTGWGRFT